MSIELRIPAVGESITEVEIGGWLKRQGERVRKDEPVVTLESEKATLELPAPESGTLSRILKEKGEVAQVGEVIAYLDKDGEAEAAAGPAEPRLGETPAEERPASAPPVVMPDAQRAVAEPGLRLEEIQPTALGGRLPGEEAHRQVEQSRGQPPAAAAPVSQAVVPPPAWARSAPAPAREEETVPMSRLRRTVAERLVAAQQTAALLTTFNEIDMSSTIALRKEYGEGFQGKYKVKLGFMSFFVKACVDALKQFPVLNAEVRGTNIVYHNYYDIGVAVGSAKGLVVPVLRNAEHLSFAEIERAIGDFARRARENKLKLHELEGGTFTISNGGVYGSLLSTPIVNPPQSGVLGMHAIQERPVAREANVVIRPMMYVALTYDHRIVDGREAVWCLKRIKEVIENPGRLLMEV